MSKLCLSSLVLLALALPGGCSFSPTGVDEVLRQAEEASTSDDQPAPNPGSEGSATSGYEDSTLAAATGSDEEYADGMGEVPSAPAAEAAGNEPLAPDPGTDEILLGAANTDGEYPDEPQDTAGDEPAGGADSGDTGDESGVDPCGTPHPSDSELQQVAADLAPYVDLLAGTVAATLTEVQIPVHFHVISDGVAGDITDAQIGAQLDALNASFSGQTGGAGTPFRFALAGVTRTTNATWFHMEPLHDALAPQAGEPEWEAKRSLHVGDAQTLNIYTCQLSGGLLGWSRWPWWFEPQPLLDGVVVDFETVPGNTIPGYEEGDVAVHEVGHWLGLFHTFGWGSGFGCEFGDEVEDTPAEAWAAFGCPVGRDTCPDQAGADPIHNFMDYTLDACKLEFTEGQNRRACAMLDRYRDTGGGPPPVPPDPAWIDAVAAGPTAIDVSWAAVSDATHYRLAKLDQGEDPNNAQHWDNCGGNVSETSLSVTGLSPGTSYRFRIKACHDDACSDGLQSDWVQTGSCDAPVAPSNLTAPGPGPTSVVLHWQDNSDNETSFRIARLDPGEDPGNPAQWDNVGVVDANATTLNAGGLSPNATYRFKVRAANDCGYSAYTNEVIVQTGCPVLAAPTNLTAPSPGATSVSLYWQDNSNNETSFRIARLDPGEDPGNPAQWDNVGVVDANVTTFTAGGLSPNATYRFKVRAANDCGYSAYTNEVIVQTVCAVPAAPSNLTAPSPGATSVTLYWQDNSNNETSFRIARLDPGEDPANPAHWDNVGTVNANVTSFTAGGLSPNATYRFKVRAANDCGYSAYTNEVIVQTVCAVPAAPSNLTAPSPGPTSVTLYWQDNSNNETSFRIARLDPGEDPANPAHWDNVGTVNANVTSFTAGGLSPNATYRFKVRAANDCGYSAYTNEVIVQTVCAVPAAPSNLTAPSPGPTSVTLYWQDNSNNETSFRIARLDPGEDPANPAHWDNVGTVNANVTSFTAGGLSPNATYRFKVRAANDGGYSAYTNEVIVQTVCPPAAPSNCDAARDHIDVVVTWQDNSNNETGFNIARLDPPQSPDDPGANWNHVGSVGANVTTWRDTSPKQAGARYYYKVRAKLEIAGEPTLYSEYSNWDDAIPRP